MFRLFFVFLCLSIPTVGNCVSVNSQLTDFDDYKEVKLKITDGVSGGCWTNLKEVREYSEEKIKMSGMTLNDDGSHFYTFLIQSIGSRTDGMCFGQITVGLYSFIQINDDLKALVTIKEVGTTFKDYTFNTKVIDMIGQFFKGSD